MDCLAVDLKNSKAKGAKIVYHQNLISYCHLQKRSDKWHMRYCTFGIQFTETIFIYTYMQYIVFNIYSCPFRKVQFLSGMNKRKRLKNALLSAPMSKCTMWLTHIVKHSSSRHGIRNRPFQSHDMHTKTGNVRETMHMWNAVRSHMTFLERKKETYFTPRAAKSLRLKFLGNHLSERIQRGGAEKWRLWTKSETLSFTRWKMKERRKGFYLSKICLRGKEEEIITDPGCMAIRASPVPSIQPTTFLQARKTASKRENPLCIFKMVAREGGRWKSDVVTWPSR